MAGLVFTNLLDMKIFNNRRIAIYYLNNLHPKHNQFDLDNKDIIKKLIEKKFISADEIDSDIIEYFNLKLKTKHYIQQLAKDHFMHAPNSHTFHL